MWWLTRLCGGDKNKHSDIYTKVNIQWKKHFDALNLTDWHVGQLYTVYEKMDQDHSGTISLWEMLEYLGLTRSKFTKRVFSIMDEDGSGEIDFREFVVAMWNYCTLGKASLILFAFDLYDNDSSGHIDFHEIELMLKEVYGKAAKTSLQAQSVFNRIVQISGGTAGAEQIGKEQFTEFVRVNPALLYPAFQLQTQLQKSVLGTQFWSSLSNSRVQVEKGSYMTVTAWLNVQLNQAAFDKLIQNDGSHDPETKPGNFKPLNGQLETDELYKKYQTNLTTRQAGTVAQRRERSGIETSATVVTTAAKLKAARAKSRADQESEAAAHPSRPGADSRTHNLKREASQRAVRKGQHKTADHLSYGNYTNAKGSGILHAKSSAQVHPT